MKDCHIHLQGNYSLDNIDKIVNKAIQMNLDEIWLLEHTYMFKEFLDMYDFLGDKNECWFSKKISEAFTISLYHDLINKVRNRSYPIVIKFGLEVCYSREKEEYIKKISDSFNYDFLLGSIHYVFDFAFARIDFIDDYNIINIDDLFNNYFDLTVDLINSKLFTAVAHPDLIKLRGFKPSFDLDKCYEKVVKAAKENGVCLEQSSGINRKFNKDLGMDKKFLKIALENEVLIITSSDSHSIDEIGYKIDLMKS